MSKETSPLVFGDTFGIVTVLVLLNTSSFFPSWLKAAPPRAMTAAMAHAEGSNVRLKIAGNVPNLDMITSPI
jgi:hypothetical protein